MEAVYILRRLIKTFGEKKRGLHMVFIYLRKAYDRIPREVMWQILEKKHVYKLYIVAIKDIQMKW